MMAMMLPGPINHLGAPWALALLVALPLLAILLFERRRRAIVFSSARIPAQVGATWRTRLRGLPAVLHLACLALLIVALARPQETSGQTRTSTEGIAMQLVIDRSGSMREPIEVGGRQVSRIELVKQVVRDFVLGNEADLPGRPGDMIGLIAFGRYSDTLAPLSRAHAPLVEAAQRIELALTRGEDGTAIGEGLSLAAARLKRAEEEIVGQASRLPSSRPDFTIKSKVIILLTDGQNNAGEVTPQQAAELARQWGIRVYTIGVGAGDQFMTVRGVFGDQRIPVGNAVDERMLRGIAEMTGGKYWPAENGDSLRKAYAEIDALEKSKIDATEFTSYTERYMPFAAAGAALLALELLLASTALRRVP
ncbi:MAG: VWA domain-containing protein [Phycisphaerales bacterium]